MIEVKNISKEIYSETGLKKRELKNISLSIHPGKITTILGAKGSGKTTLLKIISSLDIPTDGEIINPSGKKIIYLPQEPSSFPWLNVSKNVSFGLNKFSEEEINDLISLVELDSYENFHPDNRSLGFRFRIALARSLAHDPALIALDNPFAEMDGQTKHELYMLIKKINSERSVAFLIATTNINEALLLSDHIYLLRSNMIEGISKQKLELNESDKNKNYSTLKNHFNSILEKISPDELSKISF